MRGIILIYIIQPLLYLSPRVESLTGAGVKAASISDFPFIVSLQYYPEKQHFCTGTLITRKHVITAAHCLNSQIPYDIQIVIKSQSVTVRHTIVWWQTYDSWAHSLGILTDPIPYDIAILELEHRVDQLNINPARLNELNKQQLQGRTATITGWKGDRSPVLQKAKVTFLSDEECLKKVELITNELYESSSSFLCTMGSPHAVLECGDSGAPIVDQNNSLLGVSYGPCPNLRYAPGNFSVEFLQQYQVNLHSSIDYYRYFIVNSTGYQ